MSSYTLPLGVYGGMGGSAWDDRAFLATKKLRLGYGSQGMLANSITMHHWGYHLGCNQVEYKSIHARPQTLMLKTAERGLHKGHANINLELKPFEERVVQVSIWLGHQRWMAGASCVNGVEFVTESLTTGSRRTVSFGACESRWQLPASVVVTLPQGFTVAGFYGRSGDSLDQLGLYVCPCVPQVWQLDSLARCPTPFQQQVAAMEAALEPLELPGNVLEALQQALWRATFFGDGDALDHTPPGDDQQPEGTPAAPVAEGEGKGEGEHDSEAGAAALPAGDAEELEDTDYIHAWCVQQVQAAAAAATIHLIVR